MKIEAVEWTALIFAAVLLGLGFLSDFLYIEFWFLGGLITALVWIVAALVAIFSIGWAFDGREHPVRRGLAMPLALMIVLVLGSPVEAAGKWTFAKIALERERTAMESMAARANGQPVARQYLQGIPDSGVSFVRSAQNPQELPVDRQILLLSEPINDCRAMEPNYWLCGHGG